LPSLSVAVYLFRSVAVGASRMGVPFVAVVSFA